MNWKQRIRTDVDDRSLPLSKKVSDAEKEWVPFTIFIGKEEFNKKIFTLRERGKKDLIKMSKDGLIGKLRRLQRRMPWRPLPVPMLMSKRAVFV